MKVKDSKNLYLTCPLLSVGIKKSPLGPYGISFHPMLPLVRLAHVTWWPEVTQQYNPRDTPAQPRSTEPGMNIQGVAESDISRFGGEHISQPWTFPRAKMLTIVITVSMMSERQTQIQRN